MKTTYTTIDEYIATFPADVQAILQKVRAAIRKSAPGAEEAIKYRMPTFVLKGNLVHFAAFKNHIGFYPAPAGIEEFKAELAAYPGAKGSIQFPLDRPIPYNLIGRIVKFRVKQNLEAAMFILVALSCAFIAWWGGVVTLESFQKGAIIENVLQTPQWLIYVSIPLGFALTAIEFARKGIEAAWTGG